MTDAIDNAVTQSANRAAFVGAAVKYLGKDRQRDAELLGDLMVAAIDKISLSASVMVDPTNSELSDAALKDLVIQMQRHATAIARDAVLAMTDVFHKTLIVAMAPRVVN